MVNEMKEQEVFAVGSAEHVPVFTNEFLHQIEANPMHAAMSLAPAIQMLIDLEMLKVVCPDVRPALQGLPNGQVMVQAEPREATYDLFQVQIQCECRD